MCYWPGKCTVFKAGPCIFQPGNFTGWGSNGVNIKNKNKKTTARLFVFPFTIAPFIEMLSSLAENTYTAVADNVHAPQQLSSSCRALHTNRFQAPADAPAASRRRPVVFPFGPAALQ